MLVTGADVVTEARTWIDTPYEHQHREKGFYVDCAGVVVGTCRNLGLVAPDFDIQGYARRPDGVSLIEACDKYCTRVSLWALKPGHMLVLRFGEDPQHMGIVGDYRHGGLSLIHAYSQATPPRVVEHRLLDTATMKKLQGYALPGVTY